MKKNILLISFVFSPNIGGVESHLDDLCNFLTKKGHEITVITYKPFSRNVEVKNFEKREGLEIRRLTWFKPEWFNMLEKFPLIEILYLVPIIFIYSFFYLLFNKRKTDVIQVHGFNMAIVGAALSVIFDRKLVVNTHVSFYFEKDSLYARVLKFFLGRADKILVLTKEAKKELKKIGIKDRKIILYHQWIDEKTFKPKNKILSRRKLHFPENKFTTLFVGRLAPAKGINILLEAAKKLNENIQLVFVGSGPLSKEIKTHAKKNKNLIFAGKVPFEDLPYYYSAAEITIIPSTPSTKTYSEGIPRVMIESFFCGTPVMASAAGGIKEHINYNNGFLIEANSASIVRNLNKVYQQRKQLLTISKNCFEYARDEFSLLKNAQIIEKSLL